MGPQTPYFEQTMASTKIAMFGISLVVAIFAAPTLDDFDPDGIFAERPVSVELLQASGGPVKKETKKVITAKGGTGFGEAKPLPGKKGAKIQKIAVNHGGKVKSAPSIDDTLHECDPNHDIWMRWWGGNDNDQHIECKGSGTKDRTTKGGVCANLYNNVKRGMWCSCKPGTCFFAAKKACK